MSIIQGANAAFNATSLAALIAKEEDVRVLVSHLDELNVYRSDCCVIIDNENALDDDGNDGHGDDDGTFLERQEFYIDLRAEGWWGCRNLQGGRERARSKRGGDVII